MSPVNCRTNVHASLRGGMSKRMEGVRPGFAAGIGVQHRSNTWDRNSWPHCYLRAAAPAPTPHQGFGRAHSSPGIARDTEHAARPRNVRFVDTVDSYKIRTRRAPQHRPPPRPARRIVYDQPSVTRISTLPTTARGTPHYHGTRNPAPTWSCRCPPALPSMPAWMAPPHLPTEAQTSPRNLELLLPTSVQGPVQVRAPPCLNG